MHDDIYGTYAGGPHGPSPDDIIDRDLTSPQFVSWTARREAKHLLEVVSHLWPDDKGMVDMADKAHDLICAIDDAIEGRTT